MGRLRLRSRASIGGESGSLLDAVTDLTDTLNVDRTITTTWTNPAVTADKKYYRQVMSDDDLSVVSETLIEGAVPEVDESVDDPFDDEQAVIPLSAYRLDGGSGAVTASNGILLPEGLLTAAQLNLVAYFEDDVEVACYVEALSGEHEDGSLIAILVQADIDTDDALDRELRIGTAKTVARLTKATIIPPYMDAALLPSNASDWLTNTVLLPTLSRASTPVALQPYDTHLDGWTTVSLAGANPDEIKWDRPHGYVMAIARDPGNSRVANWFKMACTAGQLYWQELSDSFDLNGYANNPGQSTIALGVAWYYLLSGDEDARYWLGAEAINQLGDPADPDIKYPDGRINHFLFLSATAAALVASNGVDEFNARGPYTRAQYVTAIDLAITKGLAEQVGNGTLGPIATLAGGVAGNDSAGVTNQDWFLYDPVGSDKAENTTHVMYYLAAMWMLGMIFAVELLPELSSRRAEVLAAAKRMCDRWIASGTSLWDATSKNAKYESDIAWPPLSTGSQGFLTTNGWLAMVMGWVYQETGTATYKTWGDALFGGMVDRVGNPGSGTYGAYDDGGGSGNFTNDEQALNQYAIAAPYLGFRGAA